MTTLDRAPLDLLIHAHLAAAAEGDREVGASSPPARTR